MSPKEVRVTAKCMCGKLVTFVSNDDEDGSSHILHELPMCKDFEADDPPDIYARKVRIFNGGEN